MKIHVVTFATGGYDGKYGDSVLALRHSALSVGEADSFRVYTENDPVYALLPADFKAGTRGFGWWAWKPRVIRAALDFVDDGDVVVYSDAAVIFQASLKPFANAVNDEKPVLLSRVGGWAENDYALKKWTKTAVFDLAPEHLRDSIRDDVKVSASFQVWKKTAGAIEFADTLVEKTSILHLIDDSRDPSGIDAGVIDMRHDQSILGVLALGHFRDTTMIVADVTQWGASDDVRGPQGRDDVVANGRPVAHHHRQQLKLPSLADDGINFYNFK